MLCSSKGCIIFTKFNKVEFKHTISFVLHKRIYSPPRIGHYGLISIYISPTEEASSSAYIQIFAFYLLKSIKLLSQGSPICYVMFINPSQLFHSQNGYHKCSLACLRIAWPANLSEEILSKKLFIVKQW